MVVVLGVISLLLSAVCDETTANTNKKPPINGKVIGKKSFVMKIYAY